MNFMKLMLFLALAGLVSCDDDDDSKSPIQNGASVEIRNTLQTAADPSQGGTGGAELPVETILGQPTGTFELSSTVSDAIEFDDYLEGLYDVNLSENSIRFDLVAASDHPIYSNFFRTIEAGTLDRYYLTFPNGHNIQSASSNHSSVSLNITSTTEVVVVIGEGWNFNPGSSFTLTLE